MKNLKKFIIPIFIPHAGCPHRCIFCDQGAVTGIKGGRIGGEEIESIVLRYVDSRPDWEGDIELAFFGGSFTSLPMQRQLELLRVGSDLIEDGLIDEIRISTRPDSISDKILKNLISHGVKTVELGVQSMSDEVLLMAQRGHTSLDTKNAVDMITAHGLSWIAQIMPGLPGDTREAIIDTSLKISEMGPDGVRIYPTLVIKNTDLERIYRDGEYTPLTFDETISIVKEMVSIFNAKDIPTIRIGLHPSKELQEKVVDGPYDSSLGARVMESFLFDRISSEIEALNYIPNTLKIGVDPMQISSAVGNNKINIINLKKKFGLKDLKISPDEKAGEGEVIIYGF